MYTSQNEHVRTSLMTPREKRLRPKVTGDGRTRAIKSTRKEWKGSVDGESEWWMGGRMIVEVDRMSEGGEAGERTRAQGTGRGRGRGRAEERAKEALIKKSEATEVSV